MIKRGIFLLFGIILFMFFIPFVFAIYNTDPSGLADYKHVVFIDMNNPNCNNSYNRTQAMNASTPWCKNSSYTTSYSTLQPGDIVYYKNGTYYGGISITSAGNSSDYISFQPYPGDNVTINPEYKYLNDWNVDENGIYYINISKVNGGNVDANYVGGIIENGFGISKMLNYSDLINVQQTPYNLTGYDLLFVNTTENRLYLKNVTTSTDSIYLGDYVNRIDIQGPYIEFKGFTIKHGQNGIKVSCRVLSCPYQTNINLTGNFARIINNTITNTNGQGIQEVADNILIEGNNFSMHGTPLSTGVHAIYGSGTNGVYRNNSMSRCYSWCMHPWASDMSNYPRNYRIYNNYIEGGLVISGNNNSVYNNIIKRTEDFNNYTTGLQIYRGINIRFYNNLIIGGYYGIGLGSSGSVMASQIEFKNNIVMNHFYGMIFNITNLSQSNFSNNIYFNNSRYGVSHDYTNSYSFLNFSSYLNYMNSLGQEIGTINSSVNLSLSYSLNANSSGIDNGTAVSEFSSDYTGKFRPIDGDNNGNASWDIGPFEYGSCSETNGGVETCDGLDNDCDNIVDENNGNCGLGTICVSAVCVLGCTDSDSDGYNITGGSCGSTDCNDTNSSIWRLVDVYPDEDGDEIGYGEVSSICFGNNIPQNYSTILEDRCPLIFGNYSSNNNRLGCPPPRNWSKFMNNFSSNLSNLEDFKNISLILGIESKGTICFTDAEITNLNLDDNLFIERNYIEINTSAIPGLNRSATINLFNLSNNLVNISILKDNISCADCSIISYSNKNISFSVPHFTKYEVAGCGDGVCQSQISESCSSCLSDCGQCSVTPLNTGGSSGGGDFVVKKVNVSNATLVENINISGESDFDSKNFSNNIENGLNNGLNEIATFNAKTYFIFGLILLIVAIIVIHSLYRFKKIIKRKSFHRRFKLF